MSMRSRFRVGGDPAVLRRNIEFARSGASIEELSRLNLDELIEMGAYGDELPPGPAQKLQVAIERVKQSTSPAAESAATAKAALAVAEKALENGVEQRRTSTKIGIVATVVSSLALIASSYIAFFKKAEVSDQQMQRLKQEITLDLSSQAPAQQPQNSLRSKDVNQMGGNPFVPPRRPTN
jgi:hypothetical protein